MTASLKKPGTNSRKPPNKVYYPVFLNLTGKRCLVVGGGRVAERKCLSLVKAGAKVTVVSPDLTARLRLYNEKGLIKYIDRSYRSSDIKSAFIVIAATSSAETNERVFIDAHAASQDKPSTERLLNIADRPALSSFIVPSVVKRGLLTIAISTGGASPAIAKTIRRELQGLYGPEFSRYLSRVKKAREKALEEISDKKERARFLKRLARTASGQPVFKKQP